MMRRGAGHCQPQFRIPMLSKLLLPQSYCLITSLDVDIMAQDLGGKQFNHPEFERCLPDFDSDTYNEWWNTLASMPRLKRLSVKLQIFLFPQLNNAVCDAILKPIDRMHERDLSEFHIAAPEITFRLFRRHKNPPYTSISFYTLPRGSVLCFGGGDGRPRGNGWPGWDMSEGWDDGTYRYYPDRNDEGSYFPTMDEFKV
jgi:hypothetical protein